MHRYLMSVKRYFGGESRFEVEAENKTEALEVARNSYYFKLMHGEIIKESLVCVRKLKPSFGEEYEKKMADMRSK